MSAEHTFLLQDKGVLGCAGWKYQGTLCEADNTDTGCLWEYPVLAKLPEASTSEEGDVVFDYRDQEVASSSAAERDYVFLTGDLCDPMQQHSYDKIDPRPWHGCFTSTCIIT